MSGFKARAPRGEEEENEQRVRDVPRPNFELFYDPTDWQLTADGDLIPSISHVSMAPGAGADPNGDFTNVRVMRERRGEIRIPSNVLGKGTRLVNRYTNRHGKSVHRPVFLEPYAAAGATKWRPNMALIAKFVKKLRSMGVIKPPTPQVVRGLLAHAERKRNRLVGSRPPSSSTAALDAWEAKLRMFEGHIEKLKFELEQSIHEYGDHSVEWLDNMGGVLDALEEDGATALRAAQASVAAALDEDHDTAAPTEPKGGKLRASGKTQ